MKFIDPDDSGEFVDPDSEAPSITDFAFRPKAEVIGADRSLKQLEQDFLEMPLWRQLGEVPAAVGELSIAGPTVLGGLALGGMAGAKELLTGGTGEEAAQAVGEATDKYTYMPRTNLGQSVFKLGGELVDLGKQGLGAAARTVAPKSMEAGAETLGEAVFEASLFTLPFLSKNKQIRNQRLDQEQQANLAKWKSEQRAIQEAQELKETQELEKINVPYKPTNVEKSISLSERRIETDYAGITDPAFARRLRTYPESQQTVEPFPFEFEKHENAVPFPLRQEVLSEYPEVRSQIDSFRTEYQRLKEAGASKAALNKLETKFGEMMRQYGVRNREEALGLQIPLYESGKETRLPLEKVQSLIDRTGKRAFRQGGQFNPSVFVDGFNEMKIILKGGARILAFSQRDLSDLPERIAQYVRAETNYHLESPDSNPPFRLVAIHEQTKKPMGILELRSKGDFLEPDWVWIDPEWRNQGLAKEAYTFARELGNDIRASITRTPEGLQMWKSLMKDPTAYIDEATGRPVLPKIGLGTMRQGGAIQVGGGYNRFKKAMKTQYGETLPEEIIRGFWKAGRREPPFASYTTENIENVVSEIPGIREKLKDLITTEFKTLDEVKPEILSDADIPGNVLAKGLNQLSSGIKMTSRFWNSKYIKFAGDHINAALQTRDTNVYKLAFSKEHGVIDALDNLSAKEQIKWWEVVDKYKGEKWLNLDELKSEGFNDLQISVYNKHKKAMDVIINMINEQRALMKKPPVNTLPGYFPASFVGDFFVRVSGREGSLIDYYFMNNKWALKKVIEKIKEQQPDWVISPIEERRPYRDRPSQYMNVYHDLQNILEQGDPRRKVLADLVKEFRAIQSSYTAGTSQHFKYFAGVRGSAGRNEFIDAKKNAQNAFKALNNYISASMEWVEINKITPTISRMLDPNEFPNHPNARAYASQYWARARGLPSAFAEMLDTVVTGTAHTFGISGGAVKSMVGATKTQLMLLLLGYNNPRFIAAQLFQPNQFLAQNLLSLNARGLGISPTSLAHAWGMGFYYMGALVTANIGKRGLSVLPEAIRSDMKWAYENQIVEPRMFEDIRTDVEKMKDNIFGYINGQWSIRKTEELARTQAFITFNEVLRQAGLKGQERRQLAADMTRHAMVDYRPHEKPLLYQNLGLVGDMISPLKIFSHNYYSQLAVALAELKRNPLDINYMMPVAVTLIMQQLVSGLMGLPGREDWDTLIAILKDMGLIDLNRLDLTQLILQMSKEPSFITNGVSIFTGFDMSPTFAAASLIPDRGSELFILPGKLLEIGQAAKEATLNRTDASLWNLGLQMAPAGAPRGFVEHQMMEGDMLPDPRHNMRGKVRRDNKAILGRYAGITTAEESKEKAVSFRLKQNEQRLSERKGLLIERAAEAYKRGEDYKKYVEESKQYGMTPKEFLGNIKQYLKEQKFTEKERFQGIPPKSYNQYRKYKEMREYGK